MAKVLKFDCTRKRKKKKKHQKNSQKKIYPNEKIKHEEVEKL